MAGYNLVNRVLTNKELLQTRNRARKVTDSLSIVDPVVDEQWGRLFNDSGAPNSYYDYYYTGQDVRVYIAELGDDETFGSLPIHSIGWSIEQQKMPLYGYASYTYDAVARGTRMISGQFVILSPHPGYMKRVLMKAAKNRADRQGRLTDQYSVRHLTEDDANIEKYWTKHLDAGIIGADTTEWSAHPPFSFVVVHGIQDTSVSPDNMLALYSANRNDNALFQDHNQRLIHGDQTRADRYILDTCELQSVQHTYSPDGLLVAEGYQFFARDCIVPKAVKGGGSQFVNIPP